MSEVNQDNATTECVKLLEGQKITGVKSYET